MQKIHPGSPTLFFLIRLLTTAYGVSALALLGLTIWLWREFNAFTMIEIVFLLLALVEVLLVLLIWTAKTSKVKLRCFLFFMMILFVAELICVIVVFVTGKDIINKIAKDSQAQINRLKNYLNIINYYIIGTLGVMVALMLSVYCYIGSLRERNNQFDYKILDKDTGMKMSLQEKNTKQENKIKEKYSKKREEAFNKYGYS